MRDSWRPGRNAPGQTTRKNSSRLPRPEIPGSGWKRNPLIWPAAGIVFAALAAANPFYRPHITLLTAAVAWLVDLSVVLALCCYPIAGRAGAFAAGLFFAVPCFLGAPPFWRGMFLCTMAIALAVAVLPWFGPPTAGLGARLHYLLTWLGTRELDRRPRSFEWASLLHLLAATVICAMALVCAKAAESAGLWLIVRWLGGGIMILGWAEMVTASHNLLTALLGLSSPPLMLSPSRSTSLSEFWSRRWNPAASALLFHKLFFAPRARRGVVLAMVAAFLASAVAHLLLFGVATRRWGIACMCGAFFAVQPVFILAERRMEVRRWRPVAARAWTLAALAIPLPLFIEPTLQCLEPSWGPPESVLLPATGVLGVGVILNTLYSLASLACCPRLILPMQAPQATAAPD